MGLWWPGKLAAGAAAAAYKAAHRLFYAIFKAPPKALVAAFAAVTREGKYRQFAKGSSSSMLRLPTQLRLRVRSSFFGMYAQ